MLLYEEHMVTTVWFRNMVHVTLTTDYLTFTTLWIKLKTIPVKAIREVALYKALLSRKIIVTYSDTHGLPHYAEWTTRRFDQWNQVFHQAGIPATRKQ